MIRDYKSPSYTAQSDLTIFTCAALLSNLTVKQTDTFGEAKGAEDGLSM